MHKLISIITPCYNEAENVKFVYERIKSVFADMGNYDYEHIFIDNSSKDNTVDILRTIANADRNVRIIVNNRNFGHVVNGYYAMLQSAGDAVVLLFADMQDPPELIPEFLKEWEIGFKVVLGIKETSEEPWVLYRLKRMYYRFISRLSDIELVENNNGFGLYDREVIRIVSKMGESYPYFRGLVAYTGFESAKIPYVQSARRRGKSKNKFYTLFDLGMTGITSHSKIPLRLATIMGFSLAVFNLFVAVFYFLYKLVFWSSFTVGIAPIVIGIFFFGSVQLFFTGIIGEYIGTIHTNVQHRPLVIEKERINFD